MFRVNTQYIADVKYVIFKNINISLLYTCNENHDKSKECLPSLKGRSIE